jgi:hypothetical protein
MTATTHKVFSSDSNLAETEFLRREFGFETRIVNPKDFNYSDQNKFLIADRNSRIWHPILEKAKPKSIIFLLFGNETYDAKITKELCSFRSVISVYSSYDSLRNSLFPLKNLVQFFLDHPQLVLTSWPYFIFFKSLRIPRKNPEKKLRYFPLGYTGQFAMELSALTGDSTSSLIDQGKNWLHMPREYEYCFAGQKGTPLRQHTVNFFSKRIEGFYSYNYSGWSDNFTRENDQDSYVEVLLNSRFSICPVGNISNLSFRLYESLIAGAFPIAYQSSIQDSRSLRGASLPSECLFHSLRTAFSRTRKVSEDERVKIVEEGLSILKSEISHVEFDIRNELESR